MIILFKQAFNKYQNKWVRSIFSALGVIIATVALIIIGNLFKMMNYEISKKLQSHGGHPILLNVSDPEKIISYSELCKIIEDVNGIDSFHPIVQQQLEINGKRIPILGTTSEYGKLFDTKILEGRALHENDDQPYVVITENMKEQLINAGIHPYVGAHIIAESGVGEVIGVTSDYESNMFLPQNKNGTIITSLDTFSLFFDQSDVSQFIILSKDIDEIDNITTTLQSNIKEAFPGIYVSVMSPVALLKAQTAISGITTMIVYAVVSVCSLLGGIGIMNMNVAEIAQRKNELALRMAFGATPADIKKMIAIESITLCGVSACIGAFIGFIALKIIASCINLTFMFSITSLLSSLVFSTLVGLVSSLYPAKLVQKIPVAYVLKGE